MNSRTFPSQPQPAATDNLAPIDRINPARALSHQPAFRLLIILFAQILLAGVMYRTPIISTANALIALALGIYYLIRDHNPTRVAYVAAYITGAEVLWRITGADVFWEYGKYAISLLLISGHIALPPAARCSTLADLLFRAPAPGHPGHARLRP